MADVLVQTPPPGSGGAVLLAALAGAAGALAVVFLWKGLAGHAVPADEAPTRRLLMAPTRPRSKQRLAPAWYVNAYSGPPNDPDRHMIDSSGPYQSKRSAMEHGRSKSPYIRAFLYP
jgi:hypothetical protein